MFATVVGLWQVAPQVTDGPLAGALSSLSLVVAIRVALMLGLGLPLVFGLSRWGRSWASSRIDAQVGLIIGKLLLYVGLAVLAVSTMTELGFSLAPLLGAAGVVGIALGFASQTSVSNVIAGLFLLAERAFVVDDLIQVGDVKGIVLSVDTMSVKLRTLDNRFVRIPNETLVKSTVTNITRFPIRRLDINIGVAYGENPERVRAILLEMAKEHPLALMQPEPIVIFQGFGESSLDLLFAVWSTRENYVRLKNSMQELLKARFDEEGIEIPFPHRTLYFGGESGGVSVNLTTDRLGVETPGEAASVNEISAAEVVSDDTHEQGLDPVP
jgi:small-conductance mechanosensitive channel